MTDIRAATLEDLKYLDHLRSKESNAVGFIPLQRYESEITHSLGRNGSLYLAWDNEDPTGFIYATHSGRGTSRIIQVAVQEDARRMERASLLVDAVVADGERRHSWLTSLRCAADLEAGHFWEALGFSLEREGESKRRQWLPGRLNPQTEQGRLINVWQRVERGLFSMDRGA